MCSGLNEANSHHIISSPRKSIHAITTPGRRKFWKWSDFALSEADVAVVVVKGGARTVSIEALLEPLFLTLGHGCDNAFVVINEMHECSNICGTESHIRRDISRIFGPTVDRIPIQTVDISSSESIRSLFDRLAEVQAIENLGTAGVFVSITSIFQREGFVIVEGKIRSGKINKGDELFLMPSGLSLRADSLRRSDGDESNVASSGELVALKFTGICKSHIAAGMILVSDPSMGRSTRLVKVELSFVNNKLPIRSGFSPMITFMACHVHGKIMSMEKEPAEIGDKTMAVLSLQKTVLTAPFSVECGIKGLGRLILRQENVVIAVGVVRSILD
jgi:translation elongation factor EF-1alpha